MKHILLLVLSLVLSVGAIWAAESNDGISFDELSYDFGTVKADGPIVSHDYVFTNTSDVPLTVMSASANCGCTRAKYSPEPVRPGEKGKITIQFHPLGQRGYISKNVKVRYKLAGKKVKSLSLKISGNVNPK